MFKYSRKGVLRIANENNFLVNNTEKVLRLCQILNYINQSEFGKNLLLKGGTAINVFLLNLERLSVDIDFDFSCNLTKEALDPIREEIKKEITEYMMSEEYHLSDKSKFTHALDSFVFNYQTTSNSRDSLKIEINYSDRVHVLDLVKDEVSLKIGEMVKVNRLSNDELIGSKISALITRTTPRDIYDVYNALKADVCNLRIARKIAIFYVLLGSDLPIDFEKTIDDCLNRINSLNYNLIKKTLIPVLKREEKTDIEEIKKSVSDKVKELFSLSDKEKTFIDNFNKGVFNYELLFDDIKTNNIEAHPMVIWKMSNIK